MTEKITPIKIQNCDKDWFLSYQWGRGQRLQNQKGQCVALVPPSKTMVPSLLSDGWYWVNGCPACNSNDRSFGLFSYYYCDEHNHCEDCNTVRDALTDAVWATRTGFRCQPCEANRMKIAAEEALNKAALMGHSEEDTADRHNIICPHCASVYDPELDELDREYVTLTCPTCNLVFNLEIETAVTYTTYKPK